MKRPTFAFDEDRPAPKTKRAMASHRATTSSRTPGKVNRGTVYAREDSGLPDDLELCVCGQRRATHFAATGHAFTRAE